MPDTKFTPGIWKFKKRHRWGTEDGLTQGWVETNEQPICKVENFDDGPLLAQAKNMYAELEQIANNLDTIGHYMPPEVAGVGPMIKSIEILLAGARGENQ